ncbi:hypothetical protein L1887_51070 [Cichorium endivia]|nr:hypothetical protein L1887_51070 [Cichorium endivia]
MKVKPVEVVGGGGKGRGRLEKASEAWPCSAHAEKHRVGLLRGAGDLVQKVQHATTIVLPACIRILQLRSGCAEVDEQLAAVLIGDSSGSVQMLQNLSYQIAVRLDEDGGVTVDTDGQCGIEQQRREANVCEGCLVPAARRNQPA